MSKNTSSPNVKNNKNKIIIVVVFILALILTIVILLLTNGSGPSKPKKTPIESEKGSAENAVIGNRPVLSMQQIEIDAKTLDVVNGTKVNVDFCVDGVENGWSNIGIHITYDNKLIPTCLPNGDIKFDKGDASNRISTMLSIDSTDALPEEYLKQNLACLFICSMDTSDSGTNGVIATFEFIIPPTAKAGDVYKLGFFYNELLNDNGSVYVKDMFSNSAQDLDMEAYAFANWQEGYIKIV